MTIRAVLSEVWRNVATGTTKAVLWALVTAVALTGFTVADAMTLRGIERDALRFHEAAADARKLATPGQIDAATCDRLAGTSTIQAAGAVRETGTTTVDQAPDVPLTTYQVSPGLGAVVGVAAPQPYGVWIEAGLAESLGVRRGDLLTTRAGPMPVAATFTWPDDGRDARLGFAVLVPVVADYPFDECWIRAWPAVDANDQLLLSVMTVSVSGTLAPISQINKNYGTTLDSYALYRGRVTRHVVWVAPLFFLVVGFIASWRRRLEYAAALHARQSRGALLLGVAAETATWASVGALITLTADAAAVRTLGFAQTTPAWMIAANTVWWSALAAVVGALAGATSIREKDLFRFFRAR